MTQKARAFQIQGNIDDITTLKWVYLYPHTMTVGEKSDWRKDMYETYYRLMFITGRKVWFKNKRTKTESRTILVPSPLKLSGCDLTFLKKRGFPVTKYGCTRDTCFTCRK